MTDNTPLTTQIPKDYPMLTWLRKNKFQSHLMAFALMILASIGMYFAANAGATGLIWVLLGVFGLGNLLAMLVK